MKLIYDPGLNMAYLEFRKQHALVDTHELSEDLRVDTDADGALHGIAILNAASLLNGEERLRLQVVNNETGETKEIEMGWNAAPPGSETGG